MADENVVNFKLGDVSVSVESRSNALLGALSHIYRSFLVIPSGANPIPAPTKILKNKPKAGWTAYVNGEVCADWCFPSTLFKLEDLLAKKLLEAHPESLLIHGGAVSNGETTYILIGQSGSGKTTLTLEFVRRGFEFITDEFSIIDPCATRIQPFPRAATRKYDSPVPSGSVYQVLEEDTHRSHMLPDKRSPLSARPLGDCRILFPTHTAGIEATCQPLDSAETCAQLLPSIFNFPSNERKLWPVLSRLATSSSANTFKFNNAKQDIYVAIDGFKRKETEKTLTH